MYAFPEPGPGPRLVRGRSPSHPQEVLYHSVASRPCLGRPQHPDSTLPSPQHLQTAQALPLSGQQCDLPSANGPKVLEEIWAFRAGNFSVPGPWCRNQGGQVKGSRRSRSLGPQDSSPCGKGCGQQRDGGGGCSLKYGGRAGAPSQEPGSQSGDNFIHLSNAQNTDADSFPGI